MLRYMPTVAVLSMVVWSVGCDRREESSPAVRQPAPRTDVTPRVDNTARNEVDRSGQTKTPGDQAQSSEGIRITADIRRAILDDKAMSMNAQNCKIITDATGVVTLRGVVESHAEKEAVATKAQKVVGDGKVVNELEVKTH